METLEEEEHVPGQYITVLYLWYIAASYNMYLHVISKLMFCICYTMYIAQYCRHNIFIVILCTYSQYCRYSIFMTGCIDIHSFLRPKKWEKTLNPTIWNSAKPKTPFPALPWRSSRNNFLLIQCLLLFEKKLCTV